MRARLPGVGDIYGYGIFLCSGVFAWGLFVEIVQRGAGMFIEHGNLLKKASFPKSSLPVIVVLSALVNFAVAFGIFMVFLVVTGRFPGWVALAAIPIVALLVAFATGLATFLGTLNVYSRDVGQAVTILMQFWFWLTPIVYPIAAVPEFVRDCASRSIRWRPSSRRCSAFLSRDCRRAGRASRSRARGRGSVARRRYDVSCQRRQYRGRAVMRMLELRDVGKAYRRYPNARARLIEAVAPWLGKRHETVRVLRNVNLAVRRGESVGIVGHNGAGKSTLLKLITGTAKATEGSIHAGGRIAAILELGMGFHPEFTGRQNASMSGQLLGLSAKEVSDAMPTVEAFAEIGSYFDQPLRVYSSGMQVRLAFSIATAVRPDVLIVDEALSVGDAYFQHKRIGANESVQGSGDDHAAGVPRPDRGRNALRPRRPARSRQGDQGRRARSRARLLQRDHRAPRSGVQNPRGEARAGSRRSIRSGDGRAAIESVDLVDAQGGSMRALRSNAPAKVRVAFDVRSSLPSMTVGFLIRDRLGNDVFGTNTHHLWNSRACVGGRPALCVRVRHRPDVARRRPLQHCDRAA